LKRRDFLATAVVLSLLSGEAMAAKKKSDAKPASKPSSRRSTGSRSSAKPASASARPQGPVAHTAEDPITEKPPQGTSASRLPPVKAAEPPANWQTYEVSTSVTVKGASGQTRLWLPLPLNQDTLFQRTLGHSWDGNPKLSTMRRLPDGDLEVFHSEWADGNDARFQIRTLVTTADRHFDVARRTVAPEREDILRRNLQSSQLIPNDGLAHQLGERIVGRIKDPVAQAKAVYDWVVDNTIYDVALPGCGGGNVNQQLIRGQYGGRSADINGLFVALCRAIGIPARCVYGLRVGPSRLFRSLGLNGDDATRAQHVRAEFYIPGFGWIPVDPSDVRRAMAMEGLSDRDSKLLSLRKILFGVWEMNWVAFNVGTDVELPGRQTRIPFLLLPQLESRGALRDGTDPGSFEYTISARRRVEL
jgi:transglutaminase-like putative cysteine protease